jgi:hypothetical protein
MKATSAISISLLAFANTGCLAVPTVSAASPLYVRGEQCDKKGDTIGTVTGQYGRVAAVVTFTGSVGTFTRSVCQILNERRGQNGNANCNNYAAAVSSAVLSIFSFIDIIKDNAHYEGSKAAAKRATDNSNATFADLVIASLAFQGLEYERLTTLPLPAISRRTAGQRSLQGHVLIKGVKYGDMAFDATQADFGNGDGHIFITPSDTNTSGTLQKRLDSAEHNGAGFKLSYSTRVHSGLDKGKMVELSNRISDSWNYQANNRNMGEWFGLTKLAEKHQAIFYLRIIPEVRSYGDNYENVDVCGQMAGFI